MKTIRLGKKGPEVSASEFPGEINEYNYID
jgi:hypothetical protein